MTFSIDTTSYNKVGHFKVNHGYSMRPSGVVPTTIIIHTTNNKNKTLFTFEADYLYSSADVGTHFLVGKDGRIVQIVPPAYAAWHAGEAIPAFTNAHSIGIECHHSLGDDWPQIQLEALTWLVRLLMQQYRIQPPQIETHRRVAIPGPTTTPDQSKWRKHDPNEWPDAAFYVWRDGLATLDVWSLWGNAYPLPPEQRTFGIPSLWKANAPWLKEARSEPIYRVPSANDGHNRVVVQVFQGGMIWGQDGQLQLVKFAKELP